jgi:hypothetical protein
MNLEWEDEVKRIKKKDRKLHYNEAINVYKRRRTFDGIRCLSEWLIIKDHINLKRKLNCLEVGSHEGQSSTFFLNYILLNPKSKLLCCDPWIKSHWIKNDPLGICYEDIFNYNMKKNDKHKQVKKFRGYNHDLYEKKWFHKEKYDIIYIDDIHTYESTKLNINNAYARLKKKGIIIFDDYDKKHFDMRNYKEGKDKPPSFWCDPVKKAVDQLIKKNKGDLKIIYKRYQIILQKLNDNFNEI